MPARARHIDWEDDQADEEDLDLGDYRPPPGRPPGRPRRSAKPKRARPRQTFSDEYDLAASREADDLAYRDDLERKARDKRRVDISQPFKCRNCRAFIGVPPTGGQQRNHCPLCLYSLHVDARTPGDRASDCNSLMEPIGVFYRPNLEQVLVHRCRGCDAVRYNRIAADDNPVLLAELPIVDPPTSVT